MIKPQLVKWWVKIKSLPKKYTIASIVFVVLFLYSAAFFLDKPVSVAYAKPACTAYFTLFPNLYDETDKGGYDIQPVSVVQIGGIAIASMQRCFIPTTPPEPGTTKVSLAPFGGWFMKKTFAVTVDPLPVANVSQLNQPIPATLPLNIPLSVTDKTFDYSIKANGEQVACTPKEKATSCDLAQLKLAQGTAYTFELARQFKGDGVAVIAEEKTKTLPAARVVKTSIKPNETVFSKPRSVSLAFDKKIISAAVALYKIKDDKRHAVDVSTKLDGKKVILSVDKDLARSTNYELVVESVVATDGSGLEKPYRLAFTMSGGPKVTNINIGTISVSVDTAVITFDQALSDKQKLPKAVSVSGGVKIAGANGAQLLISLADVPRCGDFSITINDKLKSKYGVTGGSKWQFTGRTVCHTIGIIGYSAQGRAINAYYFGDGATTVLYTGAIHGSEPSTKYLMDRWIQELEAKARDIPGHISVVVVPIVNPDGFAQGSRTNANNVDLNRNFATADWRTDITTVTNQPFKGGGGKAAMSEPETKALASLAGRLQPKVILSYHSIGGVVAANQAGNSVALAATYAQLSGYRNITGQSSTVFEYEISGTADDWYAEKLDVPSILIELGSHTYHQFERNQAAMWAMIHT